MNSDFRDLLRIFNEESVDYLVIGAYAVMAYTEPRFTKDLDIWIDPRPENAEKTFRGLARFGAPLKGLSPGDFSQPHQVYQVGVQPNRVDVVTSVSAIEFREAWERRQRIEAGGVPVWLISPVDLIRNKRAVGRPMDLIDADRLEEAQRLNLPASE